MRSTVWGLWCWLGGLVLAVGLIGPGHACARQVVDGCGRTVDVPDTITRVVTAGGTPSLNAFLCALGRGDTVVNGLPQGLRVRGQWKYQGLFLPQIQDAPAVSSMGPDWTPDLEALQALPHDLVLVASKTAADQLAKRGFHAYCLSWRDPQSVFATIDRLGDLMHAEKQAKALHAVFRANLARVAKATAAIPPDKRVSALYIRATNMMIPMVGTARFLIEKAGGRYAAPADLPLDHPRIGFEQLLAWNPDVLLVFNRKEIKQVLHDPRLAGLSAVKRHAVFAVPFGLHGFTHYTPEQALAVLWMAKTLYPDRFADLDLPAEARTFYARFFGRTLTDDQLRDILRVDGGRMPPAAGRG